jgi:cell division septal protein FtsQ
VKRRFIIGIFWLFGLFAVASFHFPVFRFHRVQVNGAGGDAAQVAALLDASDGDNLIRLDLGGWAERIAALPAVASVRTYLKLGGVAIASVEQKEPVALVDTDPVSGLSADGMLLPLKVHLASRDLPMVTGVGGEPSYYRVTANPRLLTALAFLGRWNRIIEKQRDRLAEIHVNQDSEVGIYIWPERRFITVGRGDWEDRLADLWPVIRRLPPSDRPLDLRFSGSVVERP